MSIQTLDEQGHAVGNIENATTSIITIGSGNMAPMSPPISNSSHGSDVQDLPSITHTYIAAPPAQINTSLVVAYDMVNAKLCGVCKEREYKYKCPRCFLPYCSVACSTLHKATHPAAPSPPPAAAPAPQLDQLKNAARAGTIAAAGQAGPFAALDSSIELQTLFKHYPNLHLHLSQIYDAMQPPSDAVPDMYEKLTGKHNRQKAWNQDRGLEKGREALLRAREAWGKDGEGVREYGEIILRIVEGVDAEESVRQELDRENARIVKALLDGEL